MTKIRLHNFVIGFLLLENYCCQNNFFNHFINGKKSLGYLVFDPLGS